MKNRNRVTLVAAAWGALALGGCASSSKTPAVSSTTPTTQPTASTAPATPAAETFPQGTGLNVANIDKSVSPCQDFNQYASGNWLKNNPIPASETRWGSFNELADKNNAVMRQILMQAAANKNAAKGTNAQKVGDYYATAMDTAAIEKAGIAPLKPELDRIASIKNLDGLQIQMSRALQLQTGAFFNAYVGQDDKISSQYAVNLYQGGLSLPDRDYYLKEDARSKGIRSAYQSYLVNTFKLAGDNEATAQKNAATVMRLETRLAKASKTRVQLRDPEANYNKMTLAEVQKKYPNLNVKHILEHLELKSAKEVIVGQPAFFQELNTMLKQEPLADLKTYLRWHLVTSMTSALPQAFGDESFKLTQVLTGAKKQQPAGSA